MSRERPLVSVCMPALNARRFLEARMASLFQQTCGDWQLIVCDSYSEDGTWEFLQSYARDPRVKLHQVPKAGLYAGWNECLKRVSGRFFCFATSDDTAEPRFLEAMTGALARHDDVDIAACQFDLIDADGSRIEPRPEFPSDVYGEWLLKPHRRPGPLEFLVHLVRGGCWTSITSVLFRTSLLSKVGLFETAGTSVVDQLWAARTALHSDTIWLPEVLATWRRHDGQASSRWNRALARRQIELTAQTIEECEPFLPSSWKFDPAWRDKLLWGARHYYRAWYGLDRHWLREDRRRFFRNLGWSILHEPSYAVRRLASGLTWSDPVYRDSREVLMDLIRDWNVPWPPAET